MKVNELKELDNSKLVEKLQELNLSVFNSRFQKAMGTLEKTHTISEDKKTIARIKTILNERKGDK